MNRASTGAHPPLPASEDPASTPPLADAAPLEDTPKTSRRSGRRRRATLNGTQPTGARVGLVSEEGDKILDVEVVHDAIAILLLRYHRKVRADMMNKGTA